MKQAEVRKYLLDILNAYDRLVEYPAGKTFEDYCRQSILRSAVGRRRS